MLSSRAEQLSQQGHLLTLDEDYPFLKRLLELAPDGPEVIVGLLDGGGVDLERHVLVLLHRPSDVRGVAGTDTRGGGGRLMEDRDATEMARQGVADRVQVGCGRYGDAADGLGGLPDDLGDGDE